MSKNLYLTKKKKKRKKLQIYFYFSQKYINARLYTFLGSKPEIAPLQFPVNMKIGKRTAVFCTVIDGDPPFSFSWFKDGIELKEGAGFNLQEAPDGFTSTLSIPKLEANSNGNYSCRVTNSKGKDEKHSILLVKGNDYYKSFLFHKMFFFFTASTCIAFLKDCLL